MEALFSVGYDQPLVDASGWYRSLRVVAKALNEGNISLAATALVLSRIPPLPSPYRADAMALADELAKFDPGELRIPKHQTGGGRWTTGDDGGEGTLEDVVYSPGALRVWGILRDTIQRNTPTVELAENAIEEVLGNVTLSELPDDLKTALQPPKSLAELRSPRPFASFETWPELEAYVGKAPPGFEWHHIIEQSVAQEHPEDPYINYKIQNTANIVLIPKLRHLMVTAEMNTGFNRELVHMHDLKTQFVIGCILLNEWGALK